MTAPYYQDATVTILHGDCVDVLAELPDDSVDSVVTDPPYGLEFMGKEWDSFKATPNAWATRDKSEDLTGKTSSPFLAAAVNKYAAGLPFQQWCEVWAAECLRVLKPGGHLLAFGGTRTWHRLVCAIEDAGFEIRDSIAWLYGSGFPKSLDVSKAIDRAAGAERGLSGARGNTQCAWLDRGETCPGHDDAGQSMSGATLHRLPTAPATPEAAQWQGFGTALKPAFEPVCVARKPIVEKTVAANVLKHGTGALNIDATRIGTEERTYSSSAAPGGNNVRLQGGDGRDAENARAYAERSKALPPTKVSGRWPANVVLDETQAAQLDQQSGDAGGGFGVRGRGGNTYANGEGFANSLSEVGQTVGYGDQGGASRFMYTAKADSGERITYTNPGADPRMMASRDKRCVKCGKQRVNVGTSSCACAEPDFQTDPATIGKVSHPTVKPLSLMRWLVRLVTPPGGTILEPFAGSGTTVEAALLEGFRCIAIEREADYLPLITQRIHRRRDPIAYLTEGGHDLGLFGDDE